MPTNPDFLFLSDRDYMPPSRTIHPPPRNLSKGHFVGQALNKLIALVALANLGLVVFDATYIRFRDQYLWHLPWITQRYDIIKGIEPHRDTQKYLDTVDRLQQQLTQAGPQDAQAQSIMAVLRDQSVEMIDTDPFQKANKSGTLEAIKNQMRAKKPNEENSAKQAFRAFWSADNLRTTSWKQELAFFDEEIRPLMATNYFRPITESNELFDQFWRIDLLFMGLFGADFLLRTLLLSLRRPGLNWLDAMLWRWYDIFLLLPFWRLLRVMPVTLRLHQSGLINLHRIQAQLNQFLAENLVNDVTEMAMVRTVSLTQTALRRGGLRQWLMSPPEAVEINEVNEVEAIADQLILLTIQRVLPKIQPDLEALLGHTIAAALNQVPLYQQFRQVPGVGQLPAEVSRQVVQQLTQVTYSSLNQIVTQALEDEQGRALSGQLTEHFMDALRTELRDKDTLEELQTQLVNFLEETKLTLLRQLDTNNVEATVAEVEQLRQANRDASRLPAIEVVTAVGPTQWVSPDEDKAGTKGQFLR